MPADLARIGRKILLWFSVFLLAFASYEWFSHTYQTYRVWESVRHAGFAFWEVQLGFWPLMIGLSVFLAVGVAALAWNVARRHDPASEATCLFWIGLAISAGFGWRLALSLAYVSVGFTSGYPLLEVLQHAIPTGIGILMVLTTVAQRMARRRKAVVPATS